jgi:hypothetical protein
MGGHVQRKGIIAPTITKSMYHSHDTNFKLMVIKNKEETSNCDTAWKLCVIEQNVLTQKKKNIVTQTKFNQRNISWAKITELQRH